MLVGSQGTGWLVDEISSELFGLLFVLGITIFCIMVPVGVLKLFATVIVPLGGIGFICTVTLGGGNAVSDSNPVPWPVLNGDPDTRVNAPLLPILKTLTELV